MILVNPFVILLVYCILKLKVLLGLGLILLLSPFQFDRGVRQGDPVSAPLFSLVTGPWSVFQNFLSI